MTDPRIERIQAEARAGMREACKQIAIEQKTCEEHSSEPNAIKACAEIAYDIEHIPDLAADEAIERIKAQARLEEAKWWSSPDREHGPRTLYLNEKERIAALAQAKEKP